MKLDIFNLNYNYTSKFSLCNINIHFNKGITAVLGPNGAGKSTMIKCIANIFKSSCDLYYNDEKIHENSKHFFEEKVSYLPQSSQSDATITVYEAVLLGLMNSLTFHVSSAQLNAVNTILELFELQPLAQRRIFELSGGQLQMVLLAQAIIKNPEILILDEPLNNLDIHRQFSLLNQMAELSNLKDMVMIIVMHDINLAARYADNIVIMDNGKIYSQGMPSEVITRKMLKDIYKIESNIRISSQRYPIAEFVGIAVNYQYKI